MNTFVSNFEAPSVDWLVIKINEFALHSNLEIVQISSFNKNNDFCALVVFRKGGAE